MFDLQCHDYRNCSLKLDLKLHNDLTTNSLTLDLLLLFFAYLDVLRMSVL